MVVVLHEWTFIPKGLQFIYALFFIPLKSSQKDETEITFLIVVLYKRVPTGDIGRLYSLI